MMSAIVRAIDRLNESVGHAVAWLALGMVLLQFAIVIARYIFSYSHPALSEAVWYQHGLLFTLAAGYTLLKDEHVRIDLFYGAAGPKQRALVNIFGGLFLLLPVCVITGWLSTSYILNAWKVLEGSSENAGLPLIFLLKTAIWPFALLLGLQALSMIIKNYAILAEGSAARP